MEERSKNRSLKGLVIGLALILGLGLLWRSTRNLGGISPEYDGVALGERKSADLVVPEEETARPLGKREETGPSAERVIEATDEQEEAEIQIIETPTNGIILRIPYEQAAKRLYTPLKEGIPTLVWDSAEFIFKEHISTFVDLQYDGWRQMRVREALEEGHPDYLPLYLSGTNELPDDLVVVLTNMPDIRFELPNGEIHTLFPDGEFSFSLINNGKMNGFIPDALPHRIRNLVESLTSSLVQDLDGNVVSLNNFDERTRLDKALESYSTETDRVIRPVRDVLEDIGLAEEHVNALVNSLRKYSWFGLEDIGVIDADAYGNLDLMQDNFSGPLLFNHSRQDRKRMHAAGFTPQRDPRYKDGRKNILDEATDTDIQSMGLSEECMKMLKAVSALEELIARENLNLKAVHRYKNDRQRPYSNALQVQGHPASKTLRNIEGIIQILGYHPPDRQLLKHAEHTDEPGSDCKIERIILHPMPSRIQGNEAEGSEATLEEHHFMRISIQFGRDGRLYFVPVLTPSPHITDAVNQHHKQLQLG